MFSEDVPLAIGMLQAAVQLAPQVQFLLEPQRHGHKKRLEADRCIGEISLEQPLKLEERLVVKSDIVELIGPQAGFAQAEVDRLLRKAFVMFLPREALFLSGCDDLSIDDQGRGRVVVERRNAQDRRHGDAVPIPIRSCWAAWS